MSGFPIFDFVVGMIFIFFLLSIICSSAVELWFAMRKTRAAILQEWLTQIFDTDALNSKGEPAGMNVGQAIMDHCMARALSAPGKSPTYIHSQIFVSALLDKITIQPAAKALLKLADGVQPPPKDLKEYTEAIENSEVISGELKRTFLALAHEAAKAATIEGKVKSELDDFRERIALWYDKNQERLTGRFKRKRVLPLTFVTALLITIGLNADSVAIGRYLYTNKEVSKQLADQGIAYIKNQEKMEQVLRNINTSQLADSTPATKLQLDSIKTQLEQNIHYFKDSLPTGLPLGWKTAKDKTWLQTFFATAGSHWAGWLATVLAICLGAPFWFDILNKIANLRSNGARPPTDGSLKDRTG